MTFSTLPRSASSPGLVQIMDGLFERDPSGSMAAFGDMMKKQIVMPAHMMDDNEHQARTGRNLFHVRLRVCDMCVCV